MIQLLSKSALPVAVAASIGLPHVRPPSTEALTATATPVTFVSSASEAISHVPCFAS